jgi:GT2 family glycosyltransferase
MSDAETLKLLPTDRDVSIVVCTRDRCDHLRGSLHFMGLLEIPPGWDVELLIVDNGSSDATRDVVAALTLQNMHVRYIFEPRKGKGYAYNAGLAAARGRVLLFTDDDVHVPHNWLEGMCSPILDGAADAVQGGVRIAPHLDPPWLTGALRVWVASVEDPKTAPEGLVGANMACGRQAIEMIGGFDPRLGPGASGFFDDTVFGWAIEKAGQTIAYRPEVAVEHHFDADRLKLSAFLQSARPRRPVRNPRTASGCQSSAGPRLRRPLLLLPALAGASRASRRRSLCAAVEQGRPSGVIRPSAPSSSREGCLKADAGRVPDGSLAALSAIRSGSRHSPG